MFIKKYSITRFMQGFEHGSHHRHASLIRIYIIFLTQSFEVIIKKPLGVGNEVLEGCTAVSFDEAVWIMRRRHNSHSYRQICCEEMIERAHDGILAGVIGIEAEHDFVDVALEDAGVLIRESGALGRDDILHAAHETGDEIELALANDGEAGIEDGALGFIEAVKDFALREDGGFGRIDVLGGLFITAQDASAEAHHPALLVADGEHEAAAEPVIVISGFLLADNQAGLFDQFDRIVFAASPIDSVVPIFGRGAKAEEFDRLFRNAALEEIIAGDLAGGFIGEGVLPALGDAFVDVQQLFLEMAGFLGGGVILELEWNLGALGEAADGVHEADVFVFFDEGEDIAALVAAEAMENLFVRIDVEAGRFLLMERAERGEVGAGALQIQITADDIDDVIGGTNTFAGSG